MYFRHNDFSKRKLMQRLTSYVRRQSSNADFMFKGSNCDETRAAVGPSDFAPKATFDSGIKGSVASILFSSVLLDDSARFRSSSLHHHHRMHLLRLADLGGRQLLATSDN